MKWILIAGILVVVLVVAALIVGWLLPEKHHASRNADAAPRRLRQCGRSLLTSMRSRRGEATSRASSGCPIATAGQSGSRRAQWPNDVRVDRSDAPQRLVVRIADPDLPFGGTWTYGHRPSRTRRDPDDH